MPNWLDDRRRAASAPGRRRRWVAWLAFAAVLVGIAHWPTTTRYGINYRQYTRELPLYEKTANFISRDIQTRSLLAEIVQGASGETESLRRIFAWTVRNIRPVPDGFPVIDDHVWNIIVRGYGAEDQRTEVFAILASYACCPAGAVRLTPEPMTEVVVAVVMLEGQPRVFDVANALMFQNPTGNFTTVDELLRDPDLVASVSRGLAPHGVPYSRYTAMLGELQPVYARMESQKPWQRFRREIARVVGGG